MSALAFSCDSRYRLNAVCPYYTMFPLEFPLRLLRRASEEAVVLDVFCGRGTTNFAAQAQGLVSYGIDSSPVAVAIAKAKLANTTINRVMATVEDILASDVKYRSPQGEFWRRAYHPDTLRQITKIRAALLEDCSSDTRIMLRAIMLGALHGPMPKHIENASYFSNQMPRTFASKPIYSINYWKRLRLRPPLIDVRNPIHRRAVWFLENQYETDADHVNVIHGNSEKAYPYQRIAHKVTHVITSPPYYGLRTYVEDQWLRNWFLGGPAEVPYGNSQQLSHASPEAFSESLGRVWDNVASVAADNLRMIVRFGAIGSRKCDPYSIIRDSLGFSKVSWRYIKRRNIGDASSGKRQADYMGTGSTAVVEHDYFISLA